MRTTQNSFSARSWPCPLWLDGLRRGDAAERVDADDDVALRLIVERLHLDVLQELGRRPAEVRAQLRVHGRARALLALEGVRVGLALDDGAFARGLGVDLHYER